MKKNRVLCTMAVLLFLNHAFAQNGATGMSFLVKGRLTGKPVDSVLVFYEGAAGNYKQTSQPVVNHEFALTGEIDHPASARLMFKMKGEAMDAYSQEGRIREFYIEPGELILTGDPANMSSLKLSGSGSEAEFMELESKTDPIQLEMKPLEEAFMKEKDHEKAAAIHDQFDPYETRIKKVTYQFFLDHPDSYVTLDKLRYSISGMSLDSIKRVYDAFNEKLKSTATGKEIGAKIKSIESGMPGSIAAAFTKTDINGKPLSLADFKGKYVMLDFWASWCVPCRKSNPHMIELYNKYKSKGFDVIGIADDDRKLEVWNAAVAKDGVGIWHNILRGLDMSMIMKHIPNPNDLDEQFGIATIPVKILIGPDGKILGRFGDSYGGTEADMDKMLASIFK